MIRKKSDTATAADVDWGFLQNEELVGLLGGQARGLARAYGLDADDVLQETYLWLAVRPDLQRKSNGMILGRTRTVSRDLADRERTREHEEYPDELL